MHADINKFIDSIPNLVEKLEENFMNMDDTNRRVYFTKNMEVMLMLLGNIYARILETEASKLLRGIKHESQMAYTKRMLKPFLTDVLSLSVTLQKAQGSQGDKKEQISKIDINSSMFKNISALIDLIEDDQHKHALKMIELLAEHNPEEEVFPRLISLIKEEKHALVNANLSFLKDKYSEAVNQLIGTDLSKKILAVDDMPEILSFVNNVLKSHYKVIAVPSAKAAIKVLETQKPDLFILDIDMPEMDGYELAKTIRNMQDHTKTPLIFLTGNSTREHITKALAVGCNDFIVKPATHDYLLTQVSKYLN
jgi:CheY-like chemotaxis protein